MVGETLFNGGGQFFETDGGENLRQSPPCHRLLPRPPHPPREDLSHDIGRLVMAIGLDLVYQGAIIIIQKI